MLTSQQTDLAVGLHSDWPVGQPASQRAIQPAFCLANGLAGHPTSWQTSGFADRPTYWLAIQLFNLPTKLPSCWMTGLSAIK
jgi:hypothetical protein